jgi:hypothetical protein
VEYVPSLKTDWGQDSPDELLISLWLGAGEAFEEIQLEISFPARKSSRFFPNRLRWTVAPHGGRAREIAVRPAEGTPEAIEIEPRQLSSKKSVRFRVSYTGLQAGMYTLSVNALPNAILVEDRPVRVQGGALSVYLPNPVKPPEAKAGQTFLCLPRDGEFPSSYRDLQGRPVAGQKVALRVWRLTKVEPRRLEFAVEGLSGRVWCEWDGSLEKLPALLPIVEEPTVRQLRAKYEGRQVWGYGGIGATALTRETLEPVGLGFERLKPARLLRLYRVWLPWVWLPLGSATYIGGRNYGFYAHHPLVVKLQPMGKAVSGMMFESQHTWRLFESPQRHALGFYAVHADAWDLERAYSLQNPFELSKRWSARERRAWRTGKPAEGISHEVLAWIQGWPCIYGTKQELKRLDKWIYENVPFEAEFFFRNGRLVRWNIPDLP